MGMYLHGYQRTILRGHPSRHDHMSRYQHDSSHTKCSFVDQRSWIYSRGVALTKDLH
jgi:hypothetical protein